MAAVTVTASISATCHYSFVPAPIMTSGVTVLRPTYGSIHPDYGSLSVALDDSTVWDVHLTFKGAPPVNFDGLNVTGGGDLFDLLNAQGWQSS